MNNAEAKFILQGYRPNGADANDATRHPRIRAMPGDHAHACIDVKVAAS